MAEERGLEPHGVTRDPISNRSSYPALVLFQVVSSGGLEPPISTFAGWRLIHLDYEEVCADKSSNYLPVSLSHPLLLYGAPRRNQTYLILLVKQAPIQSACGAYMEPPVRIALTISTLPRSCPAHWA